MHNTAYFAWPDEGSPLNTGLWAGVLLLFLLASPTISTFLYVCIKNLGSTRLWRQFEKKDTSELEQVLSTYSSEEEKLVTTTATYNEEWYASSHIFNLEQRAIFSKVGPICYSETHTILANSSTDLALRNS